LCSFSVSFARSRRFIEIRPFQKLVEPQRKRQGQLTIEVVKREKQWLIRDVDFRTEEETKEQVKPFLQKFPRAKRETP
jgi:hypothetical protein